MSKVIDLGKLRFHFAGDWSQSTQYEANDIVKYGGNVYVYTYALKASGVLPTDTSRWALMVEGFNFQGEFDTEVNYKVGDSVAHGSVVYVAVADSVGVTPPNATYWSRFIDGIQYEGEYDPVGVYQKNDVVQYGGSVFVAKQDTNGNLPTNTTFWAKFVEGISPKGVYNDGVAYVPNDLVAYGANIYRAKVETTGHAPSDTGYWELYVGGIKFWGTYDNTKEYYVNDMVVYGNTIYRSRETQSAVLPTEVTGWEKLVGGQSFNGTWDNAVTYYEGDVVAYGNYSYRSLSTQSGNNPAAEPTAWEQVTTGVNYRADYDNAVQYFGGDLVSYGANVYVALNDTLGNVPTDGVNWSQYSIGFSYEGAWNDQTQYYIGQVVQYGGSIYRAISDNTNTNPTVTATWDKLVAGIKAKGEWTALTEYATEEVVTYGGNTYISLLPHASSDFNVDLAAGKWEKFNSGIRWMGAWDSGTQYFKDDVVKAGSSSFIANQDILGGDNPAGGTAAAWSSFATGAEGFLSKDGDAMLGMLTLYADPTDDLHAATKAYADRMVNATDGGNVYGPLVFDNIGATGASLTLQNGSDLTVDGGTVTLANGATLNIDGSSTLAEVTVDGDINLNGGNLDTTQTSINVVNANATTVNFAGDATTLSVGADTGTTTINNNVVIDGTVELAGNIVNTVVHSEQGTTITASSMDPTGFDNQHPDTRGIIEYSDNGVRVYSIDKDGVATVREDSTFATGTAFAVAATANTMVIYPSTGQANFTYWIAGVRYEATALKSITLADQDGFNYVYLDGENLAETTIRTDAILTRYANVATIVGSPVNGKINSISDERHGISMDGSTLAYTVRADGTQWIDGTGLVATAGSETYTNTIAGEIRDADLTIAIPEQTGNKFLTRLGTDWKLADFDDNEFTYKLGTLNSVTVTNGGANYKGDTTTVEVQGDGEGATVELAYSAAPIATVTLADGGTNYASTTTATVVGDGTGATVEVTIPDGKTIASASLDAAGSGYTNPVVTITDTVGSGTGAVITAELDLGTEIAHVHMDALGSGYSTASATINGDGTGATATVTIVAGAVTDIDIVNPGTGYTYATVTIDGDGTGATATAYPKKSSIAGYEITNVGSGYTSATVTISGDGFHATAEATVVAGGVTDLNITNAGHSFTNATITIDGDGTGATAVPKLSGYPIASATLDAIGESYQDATVTITEDGQGIVDTPAAISATLGTGNIIGSVTLTDAGTNYTYASVVLSDIGDGTGADIIVDTQPSSILSCTVTNVGRHYSYANIIVTSPTGSGATFEASFTPVPQYNGYVDSVTGYDLNNIPAGKYTNVYFLATSSVDRIVKIPSQYLFDTLTDAFTKMGKEMKELIANGLPFDDYVFVGGCTVNNVGQVVTIPETLKGDILYADVAIGNYNEIPTLDSVTQRASDIFLDTDFIDQKDEYWTIPDDDVSVQTFIDSFFNDYENYKNYWSNINSCVRMYGGIIQDNGDGTVRIGNGGGLYKKEVSSVEGVPPGECEPMTLNGAQGGRLWFHTWDAVANLELTNNAYNYIFVTWDHSIDNGDGTWGNTKVISSTNFYLDSWQNDPDYLAWRAAHTELPLSQRPLRSGMLHAHTIGRVYKMDNEITIRVCGTNGWNVNKRLQLFGEEFFPVIRARGLDIEPVADSLKFNVTEGVMWAEMMNRFTVREFNMELGDTFYSWYQHTAEETADDLATLQATYPLGVLGEPDKIFHSTTDDKYYRHTLGFDLTDATINDAGNGLLTLTAGTGVANSVMYTQAIVPDQPFKLTLNGVTAADIGGLSIKVGTTIGGTEIGSSTNVAALANESVTFQFIPTGHEAVYVQISAAGATTDVTIDEIVYDTQYELAGFATYKTTSFANDNVNEWGEVLDYTNDKLIKNTTYPSVTELAAANPTGYYNLSEDDPANPGYKKDYVVLQLQATDAYYGYNPDAPLGDRWEYIGPKSTALGEDTISVAFIGNVEGMNAEWPNGFTGKINVIIKTLDGMFYEYSGVEGSAGWYRVQGYVERNGWLRFYGQDGVDPARYNDTTTNTLKPIPPGTYGVAWIYIVHDNTAHVVYGQDYYTSEGAKVAALPTPLPGLLAAYSTLVGKMTFFSGGSKFENAESPFLEKFISSGVSLHNDLAGLDGGNASQNKYYHLDELHYNVVNEFDAFDNDGTFASDSATAIPSQQAVREFVQEVALYEANTGLNSEVGGALGINGVSQFNETLDADALVTELVINDITYTISYKLGDYTTMVLPSSMNLTLTSNYSELFSWIVSNTNLPNPTGTTENEILGVEVTLVDTITEVNSTTGRTRVYTVNYDADLNITSITVA